MSTNTRAGNEGLPSFDSIRYGACKAVIWFFFGLAVIIGYALCEWRFGPFTTVLSTACVGIMAAIGAMLVGVIFGLLFGIPKTAAGQPHEPGQQPAGPYKPNTNLEQVSDWLTKILLGAGLTQLSPIANGIWSLAEKVGLGLGGTSAATAMGLGILISFSCYGFIVGYLATRLVLPTLFRQLELRDWESKAKITITQATNAITELKQVTDDTQANVVAATNAIAELKQISADNRAYVVSQGVISPIGTPRDVPEGELEGILSAASPGVRAGIMEDASGALHGSVRARKNEEVERIVPILRAAIKAEPAVNVPHDRHAQLGIALMHQKTPDWLRAEVELTKAIDIRDRLKIQGCREYEANRGLCRIRQDGLFAAGNRASEEVSDPILADLRLGAEADPHVLSPIWSNEDRHLIHSWLETNEIAPDDKARVLTKRPE